MVYSDYFNKIKGLLNIQVADVERVGFDKIAPRFYVVPHQRSKHFIGGYRILRKLGHQFCTEIFEPEQLAAWLATGSARP